MKNNDSIKSKGSISLTVTDGEKAYDIAIENAVLRKGRLTLAKCLANDMDGASFNFFVSRMLFGTNGTVNGQPRTVQTERDGLFGDTLIGKNVIATVDEDLAQVVFTSVLTYNEANGSTINEMALRLNNGDIYSMATFPDLNKTSSIQIVFNWRISFV